MDEHFRAYTFVDRITSIRDGRQIQGTYAIPGGVPAFPLSLVAEATGQIAAWAAMATVEFRRRPVAGLAGRVELLAGVQPGQRLDLAAEIESVDAEAVAYAGTAHVDGRLVLRLQDCLGPMVPLEEFDDPVAIRERFRILCGPGAAAGGFPGLPALSLGRPAGEHGQRAAATVRVPEAAPLFADHFPRRPVFPGSLLMHLTLELAAALAAQLPSPALGRWTPQTLLDMKLRAFIPPGQTLDLETRLNKLAQDSATLTLEARMTGEVVAGARLLLAPGEGS